MATALSGQTAEATIVSPVDDDDIAVVGQVIERHQQHLRRRRILWEDFCRRGYHLAWVTFDFHKDWTAISSGSYVQDVGFGFTMSVHCHAPNSDQACLPRIYDSSALENPTGRILKGPSLGNILVIQDTESMEPHENEMGGVIMFEFDAPSDVYSLQLVGSKAELLFYSTDGRLEVAKPMPNNSDKEERLFSSPGV